jgi:ribosomal protein S13
MESVPALRRHIERHHVTGPDLVKRTGARIALLIRMGCYVGIRHSQV